MRVPSLRLAGVAILAGLGLGGCAYGGYGPYGGHSVGVGNGYYDPYYGGYYGSRYGSYGSRYYGSPYYGMSYWGWNDGFYYPGTGYYVYDRYRNRYRWSDAQRRYWLSRVARYRSLDGDRVRSVRENWGDFRTGDGDRRVTNISRDRVIRIDRAERQQVRSAERQQVRSERQRARVARAEAREGRRGRDED